MGEALLVARDPRSALASTCLKNAKNLYAVLSKCIARFQFISEAFFNVITMEPRKLIDGTFLP